MEIFILYLLFGLFLCIFIPLEIYIFEEITILKEMEKHIKSIEKGEHRKAIRKANKELDKLINKLENQLEKRD